MAEFGRTLLLVAAVATLAGLLWPEKESRHGKLIEFAIALLVLLAIFRPLAEGLDIDGFLGGLTYPGTSYEDWEENSEMQAVAKKAIEEGIVADLSSRYGIPSSCIEASLTLSLVEEELKIDHLILTFSGEGRLLDLYALRAYAEKSYQTECEVRRDG